MSYLNIGLTFMPAQQYNGGIILLPSQNDIGEKRPQRVFFGHNLEDNPQTPLSKGREGEIRRRRKEGRKEGEFM